MAERAIYSLNPLYKSALCFIVASNRKPLGAGAWSKVLFYFRHIVRLKTKDLWDFHGGRHSILAGRCENNSPYSKGD